MGVVRGPGFDSHQQLSPHLQSLSEETSHSAVADPGRSITHKNHKLRNRTCACDSETTLVTSAPVLPYSNQLLLPPAAKTLHILQTHHIPYYLVSKVVLKILNSFAVVFEYFLANTAECAYAE